MFWGSRAFNRDISKWDVSNVTDINYLFAGAASFNGNLSKWDVSSVTDMDLAFAYATAFNGDISVWDVSSVTSMNLMFSHTLSFNGDISEWDVSRVTDMYSMFWGARSFNADISYWDVSRVIKMDYMFRDAKSFKQRLCTDAWVHSEASENDMFVGSSGSKSRSVCDRELIVVSKPKPASTSTPAIASVCTKCGTFKKSGRVSCCAPGGAWYNNCGGVGDSTVDHRWLEGVDVCKRKSKANGI